MKIERLLGWSGTIGWISALVLVQSLGFLGLVRSRGMDFWVIGFMYYNGKDLY